MSDKELSPSKLKIYPRRFTKAQDILPNYLIKLEDNSMVYYDQKLPLNTTKRATNKQETKYQPFV